MCCLRNIAMRDYQESVTTGQTDAGPRDPNVPLCFAGDTKIKFHEYIQRGENKVARIITDFHSNTVYRENFAPVLFSPSDLRVNLKLGQLNSILYNKGICKKIWEWANSRLGESLLHLFRAKVRLGEFKAVYSTWANSARGRRRLWLSHQIKHMAKNKSNVYCHNDFLFTVCDATH